MSSRNRARPTATKGQEPERSTPNRLQVRLESAQYEALQAACGEHDTDATTLMRKWVAHVIKLHRAGRRLTGMAAPETFKDDLRALVYDARLHVTLSATTLNCLKDACRSQGIAHSRVVRGCVAKILKLHRQKSTPRQKKKITPPPIRTRRKR